MRFDLKIIASWIKPSSKVLGLGCGEGDLLYYLKTEKNVRETGIEIKQDRVFVCIENSKSIPMLCKQAGKSENQGAGRIFTCKSDLKQ